MAFRFPDWATLDPQLLEQARSQLTAALNKGPKPSVIVGNIHVKELNLGWQPPNLEIMEISELEDGRFSGHFKLQYSGDGYVILQTTVQANPFQTVLPDIAENGRDLVLAANSRLVVPLELKISELRLKGRIFLVVDKDQGVTLSFGNDPITSLLVSSSFDSLSYVKRFLQEEIQKQLREVMLNDIPKMVYSISQTSMLKKPIVVPAAQPSSTPPTYDSFVSVYNTWTIAKQLIMRISMIDTIVNYFNQSTRHVTLRKTTVNRLRYLSGMYNTIMPGAVPNYWDDQQDEIHSPRLEK